MERRINGHTGLLALFGTPVGCLLYTSFPVSSVHLNELNQTHYTSMERFLPVSYTHLDVYKRQPGSCPD